LENFRQVDLEAWDRKRRQPPNPRAGDLRSTEQWLAESRNPEIPREIKDIERKWWIVQAGDQIVRPLQPLSSLNEFLEPGLEPALSLDGGWVVWSKNGGKTVVKSRSGDEVEVKSL